VKTAGREEGKKIGWFAIPYLAKGKLNTLKFIHE